MQDTQKIIDDYFEKNPSLDREKYYTKISKAGNIMIFQKGNTISPIDVLSQKTGLSMIQKSLSDKREEIFTDLLYKNTSNFNKEKFDVKIATKKQIGVYLKTDSAVEGRIIVSDGNIAAWDQSLPKLIFTDSIIEKIKEKFANGEIFSEFYNILRTVVSTSDNKTELNIKCEFLNNLLSTSKEFSFKRTNIYEDNEISKIIQKIRNDSEIRLSKKTYNDVVKSIKEAYKIKFKSINMTHKSFVKLSNSSVGKTFIPKSKNSYLYDFYIPGINDINVLRIKSNVLELATSRYRCNYNYKNKKITSFLASGYDFNKCQEINEYKNKLERIMDLVKKDFPSASFSFSNKIITWKVPVEEEIYTNMICVYKADYLDKTRKNISLTKKRIKEKQLKQEKTFKNKDFFGKIIPVAIIRLVEENEKHITKTVIVKLLRGLTLTSDFSYKKNQDCGRFNILSSSDIEKEINSLINNDILMEKEVNGTYGRYNVIKLNKNSKYFEKLSSSAEPFKGKNFTGHREYEVYNKLMSNQKIIDTMSFDTIGKNLLYFSEHPALYPLLKDEINEYARRAPEKYRELLKTYSMFEKENYMKTYKSKLASIN